jgi:hypothetical protein
MPYCQSKVQGTEDEYTNESYNWGYDLDIYSTIKNINMFEKELQKKANSYSKSFNRATPVDPKPFIQFTTVIDLDIYDQNVFTEHNATHFLTNDFEQHSVLSSTPLSIGIKVNPSDPSEYMQNYTQSYFEIKIHCGGFYD